MKIIGLKVTGYRMLDDNFSLDLRAREKVIGNDECLNTISIVKNVNMPTTTAFVGKNASGKSSVLDLIDMAYHIFDTGLVKYRQSDFAKEDIKLTIVYSDDDVQISLYKCTLVQPVNNTIFLSDARNCLFKDEKRFKRKSFRSEERRVGKECRSRWSPYH